MLKLIKVLIYILFLFSIGLNIYFINTYIYNKEKPEDIYVLETYELPQELAGYIEQGFRATFIPFKNPLGGTNFNFSEVTADYLDKEYEEQFGTQHDGIDIVPTDQYYTESPAYQLSKRIIVFATHNGTVEYNFDQHGANFLVVTNNRNNLRTFYVHLEAAYVKSGDIVTAGQPIGVMGNTGNSTGTHLHYGIQRRDSQGAWRFEDPKIYMKF
jgi:murein DD-endopeptidase MepM/ murein hydrolase activator NlpD